MFSRYRRFVASGVVMVALGLAGLHGGQAQTVSAHPAHIHKGSCPTPGDILYPLSDVSANPAVDGTPQAAPAPVGQPGAVPVETSVTTVNAALKDIVGGGEAIAVHESVDKIGTYLVCGDIGGTMLGASDLPVGLAAVGDSPYSGTALLHDNGNGTTNVSIFLTKSGASPAVSGTPAASSGQTMDVALSDFAVKSATTTFKVGQTYDFVAANGGKQLHELVIEHAAEVDKPLLVNGRKAEAGDIAPGSSKTLSWTFTEPGKYLLACHQPGHFEAGMKLEIDVQP